MQFSTVFWLVVSRNLPERRVTTTNSLRTTDLCAETRSPLLSLICYKLSFYITHFKILSVVTLLTESSTTWSFHSLSFLHSVADRYQLPCHERAVTIHGRAKATNTLGIPQAFHWVLLRPLDFFHIFFSQQSKCTTYICTLNSRHFTHKTSLTTCIYTLFSIHFTCQYNTIQYK